MPDRPDVLPFNGSTVRASVQTFLSLLLCGLPVSCGLMGVNWTSFPFFSYGRSLSSSPGRSGRRKSSIVSMTRAVKLPGV